VGIENEDQFNTSPFGNQTFTFVDGPRALKIIREYFSVNDSTAAKYKFVDKLGGQPTALAEERHHV